MSKVKGKETYPVNVGTGIGDPVFIKVQGQQLTGNIRVVLFTSNKVRYSIRLDDVLTTLHNVDSTFVEPNPDGEFIQFDIDNYS